MLISQERLEAIETGLVAMRKTKYPKIVVTTLQDNKPPIFAVADLDSFYFPPEHYVECIFTSVEDDPDLLKILFEAEWKLYGKIPAILPGCYLYVSHHGWQFTKSEENNPEGLILARLIISAMGIYNDCKVLDPNKITRNLRVKL